MGHHRYRDTDGGSEARHWRWRDRNRYHRWEQQSRWERRGRYDGDMVVPPFIAGPLSILEDFGPHYERPPRQQRRKRDERREPSPQTKPKEPEDTRSWGEWFNDAGKGLKDLVIAIAYGIANFFRGLAGYDPVESPVSDTPVSGASSTPDATARLDTVRRLDSALYQLIDGNNETDKDALATIAAELKRSGTTQAAGDSIQSQIVDGVVVRTRGGLGDRINELRQEIRAKMQDGIEVAEADEIRQAIANLQLHNATDRGASAGPR